MMRAAIRLVALAALVLGLAACSAATRRSAEPVERTTVRVENQGFLDMNIYVLRGGQRVRLGTVNGVSTQVLTIPSDLVFATTQLRFLADPIGGRRTPISHEILVQAGDEVVLQILP